MATDANRHQQTPTNTSRHWQTPQKAPGRCPLVSVLPSVGLCCCLLLSVAVRWCLLLYGDVCGCLRVYEWYLWMPGVFRCVWDLSERWVLAEWSQLCHSWTALKSKIFSTDYNETSKYQNVQISAPQKSLGYTIYLICWVRQRQIKKHSLLDHPVARLY